PTAQRVAEVGARHADRRRPRGPRPRRPDPGRDDPTVKGGTFRSLRHYNYRLWFFGSFVSNIGTWMQSTAMSWTVLTFLTPGDAAAMGVNMALQFAPPLLLVGVTG